MWCDTAPYPGGGFARVVALPGAVQALVNGQEVWRQPVETDLLRFLRLAVAPSGVIEAIGQGGEGAAWVVGKDSDRTIGMTHGQDCVAIRWNGSGFTYYVVTGPDTYTEDSVPRSMPWSSQGIRDVTPDGVVMFGDDYLRPATYNGHTFWRRTIKDGIVFGQAGKGLGIFIASQNRFFSFGGFRMAESPHCAVNGDTIEVCAATEFGPLFKTFQPPYPEDEPVNPPQPPPSDPEPPVSETPNCLNIVQEVAAQHPDLIPQNTIAACGRLTEYIAWTLKQRGFDFGLLSKTPGEKQFNGHAIDSIIYRPTQRVVDMMSGAGDRDPTSDVPENQRHEIRLKWSEVEEKRPNNNYLEPFNPDGNEPPVPHDLTHTYVGGGNDTGTCDECGRSRFDAIHAVPQGKTNHEPYLGEDGVGPLCDLCNKDVSDSIHTVPGPSPAPTPVPTPVPTPTPAPVPGPPTPGAEGILAKLDTVIELQHQMLDALVAQRADLNQATREIVKALSGGILGNILKERKK